MYENMKGNEKGPPISFWSTFHRSGCDRLLLLIFFSQIMSRIFSRFGRRAARSG